MTTILAVIAFTIFLACAIYASMRMDMSHRKRIEAIDVEEAWKNREPQEPA